MPPPQDRGHTAVLSSCWWSRIWIFYIPKVYSICSTLKGLEEKLGLQQQCLCWCCHLPNDTCLSIKSSWWDITRGDLSCYPSRGSWTPGGLPVYSSVVMCHLCSLLLFTPSALFGHFQHMHQALLHYPLPSIHVKGFFFLWRAARRGFEHRKSRARSKLKYQIHTEQPKWQDYDTESPLADERNERWKWDRGEIHPFSWQKRLTAWRSRF